MTLIIKLPPKARQHNTTHAEIELLKSPRYFGSKTYSIVEPAKLGGAHRAASLLTFGQLQTFFNKRHGAVLHFNIAKNLVVPEELDHISLCKQRKLACKRCSG